MFKIIFSMGVIVLSILLSSGWMLTQVQAANAPTLEEKLLAYRWQKRVVLVIATSKYEVKFVEQQKLLEAGRTEIKERDMQVEYLLLDNMPDTDKEFLYRTFNIKDQGFNVILVGKDGGEKMRSVSPIQTEDLFQIIDAMPMRQQEMKRKNK